LLNDPLLAQAWEDADAAADSPRAENVSHALLAVARVISSWEKEVRHTAEVWTGRLHAQAKWSAEGDERWEGLDVRLNQVEKALTDVTSSLQNQNKQFFSHLEEQSSQLRSSLADAVKNINADVGSLVDANYKQVIAASNAEALAIKMHVSDIVTRTSDKTESNYSTVGQKMDSFGTNLQSMTTSVSSWDETVATLRKLSQEATDFASNTEMRLEEAHGEVSRLSTLTDTLKHELEETRHELEKVTHSPATEVLRRLKEIEMRGRLRIDRQAGKVDFLKPVEFLPCDPSEEISVEFKDENNVLPVLSDVADISRLFGTPFRVEVDILQGKGSKEWWLQLAASQAEVIKAQLTESCGIEESLIKVRGQLATPTKGAPANSVVVLLDQEVFTIPKVDDGPAKKAGKQKK
jgi:myosin heavy subunit